MSCVASIVTSFTINKTYIYIYIYIYDKNYDIFVSQKVIALERFQTNFVTL